MRPDNPNRVRNFALQELRGGREPGVNQKQRPKKSLRLLLPAWLGGRAGKDLDNKQERND